jgi:hypothetical protein
MNRRTSCRIVLGVTQRCLFHLEHQVFRFGLFNGLVLSQDILMRTTDMTPKQMSSVPCPTRGVPAGKGCVLHSGRLRKEPHVDRKLVATEAAEKERFKSAAD